MMNDIRAKKVNTNPEDNEPPENSIPLRIVVFLMALIIVAASCFFVRTHWIMTLIYVFLIVAGSYLSYVYREEEPKWLRYTWIVGIFAVGANALREFTGPLRDDFDFVSPFVHFLAGVFVFVTFSMRRRSDLNVSSGLGLMLLCMISPVAKGIDYGLCVASYLTLGSIMLYFDCVSRTMTSWVSKPMMQAPEVNLRNVSRSRRLAKGNTIALIATLPVAAMLLFMFLPRADELLDRLWAATRSFDLNLNLQSSKQPVPEAARERTSRAWFEQHNENMKRLDTLRKKNKGEDRKIKGKSEKKGKVDMPTPSLPALKKDADLEKKAQDEARKAAAKKPEKQPEKKTPPALKDKDKAKEKKAKEDKAKEEAKEKKEKEDPKSPKDKKDKKQAEKPKDPKKEPEKALADADKKKEEAKSKKDEKNGETKDEKKDEKKDDPKSSKAGKPEGSGKSMKERSANRRKAAAESERIRKELLASGWKNKGGAGKKDGAGKGGGKEGGGADGGPSSEKKSLRPKRTTAADKMVLGINDKELPLTQMPDAPSDAVIMLVKSRRLVFLRRNCFDVYTGKSWKRSGDAKDQTNPAVVKVVDGLVEKEFIVQPAPQAVPQTPTAYPQQTYQQGYPQYSGDPNNRQVTKAPINILAGSGTTIPSAASNLPVGAGVNQPATQANKVESTASTAPEQRDFRGKERVFEFISKERPKFLVNMADAFAIPPNFPSVDLVEEIQVKAKSIGRIVPAAWIPQEIGLAKDNIQENLKVDELGVISLKKPLLLNNVFKVKTTLPMYPLNSMRAAKVKTPAEEEKIRDTFKSSLQLPETIDDEVFTLAEQQADPRYNWYVQCEQLAAFLRLNYKYDFDRQVSEGADDCVKELLFVRKTGFSCDYASAFVVMARCLGIPARVVNGYSPGKLNQVTGNQEITPSDGSTWAEAYIPDYGWVPFDATPEGFLPAQKRENNYTFTEVKKQLGIDKEKQKEELEREAIKILDFIVAALVILVLLAVSFFVGRALYKAIKRYIANRTGRGPEWGIYKKTCRQLKKRLKVKREPQETSAQFVERVRSTVAEQRAQGKGVSDGIPAALDAFMTTYNQVYFGKRADEIENLKYQADQLNKQIGTNTKSEAMAATSGAASTQSEGAVRPKGRR